MLQSPYKNNLMNIQEYNWWLKNFVVTFKKLLAAFLFIEMTRQSFSVWLILC